MKALLIMVAVLALATTAFAGTNPGIQMYVSFDQTGGGGLIHEYSCTPYVGFNAYFCLTNLGGGMTVVSFAVNDIMTEYPGKFAPPSWVNDLPGGLAIGNPIYGPGGGIAVAATQCMTDEFVVVAHYSLFPLNNTQPASIEILDHWAEPKVVVDCTDGTDLYSVLSNGSIDPAPQPVEDSTWGGIKALYQ
jgi:hypothetical protein